MCHHASLFTPCLPVSFLRAFRARSLVRPSVRRSNRARRPCGVSVTVGRKTCTHLSIPPSHLFTSSERSRPPPSLVSYRVPLDRERGLFALMHSLTLWHFIGPIHLRQKANREGGQSRPQRSNTQRAPCLGSQTYSGVLNHSKTFLRIDL